MQAQRRSWSKTAASRVPGLDNQCVVADCHDGGNVGIGQHPHDPRQRHQYVEPGISAAVRRWWHAST